MIDCPNVQEIEQGREAYIRPSSISSICLCPAKPSMEFVVNKMYGEPEEAPEATTGTDLHGMSKAIVDRWAAEGCSQPIVRYVEDTKGWDAFCLRYAMCVVQSLAEKYKVEPHNILTEHSLDMASVGFANPGTADVVFVLPYNKVVIIDYKYGYLDQGDATDNDQISEYAAAAAATFMCDTVDTYIIQPRQGEDLRVPRPASYDAEAIRRNNAWTSEVIKSARDKNPAIKPGYDQCIYCGANRKCEKLRRYIVDMMQRIELLGMPTKPDEMADLLGAIKLADKIGKDVKKEALEMIDQGIEIPGFGAGAPSTSRFVDSVQAMRALVESGMSAEDIAPFVSFKIGSLDDRAKEILAEHIRQKKGNRSILRKKSKQ